MSEVPETCNTPGLGFAGIDWESLIVPAAGMARMVGATAYGTLVPGIQDIEYQRRMYTNGWMQP